jgi:hypothetical protein
MSSNTDATISVTAYTTNAITYVMFSTTTATISVTASSTIATTTVTAKPPPLTPL